VAHRVLRAFPTRRSSDLVLGGRGMEIAYDDDTLAEYVRAAAQASPEHPVFLDRFLDDAIEIDVDALFDGGDLYLAGGMEHLEERSEEDTSELQSPTNIVY